MVESADVPERVRREFFQAYDLVEAGRLEEAVLPLQACVARISDFLPARRELALVLTKLGRPLEAIEHRLKVVECEPDDAKNRLKCINLLSECKRYEEALLLAEALTEPAGNPDHQRLVRKLRVLSSTGRIFISYRSNNASAARSVAELLLRNDFDVWFAEYEVLAFNYEDFERELDRSLREALTTCKTAIVFANREWAESRYCQEEIRHISNQYDKGRILQVCVPQRDEQPAKDWPILRDVATAECAFSSLADTARLFEWVLDRLGIDPSDRRSLASVEDLGEPTPLVDGYRGGTLGSLCVGPFRETPTPLWLKLTNPGDLESMLYGWPCETFHFRSNDPGGNVSLIVDLRVDRWAGAWTVGDLQDDREMYRRFRGVALGGYRRDGNLREGGLHLFHRDDRGNLAITYRTPVVLGFYTWRRVYVLVVQNEIDGSMGEVNLNFSLAVPAEHSTELSFRHFAAFLPLFDAIAKTLEYPGVQSRMPLASIQVGWAIGGAAVVGFVSLLVQWLSNWTIGPAIFGVGAFLGALLGWAINYRLMVVPK